MNRSLAATALVSLLLTGGVQAQGARISQWVENADESDTDKIALGYPVPLPVDTPLPFDGFRSYAGLHARHQDLANTTSWVHPVALGATRAGRTIWAYRLGDEDLLGARWLPEQAMLTNGGIHAREWQSPETVTGIMELLATQADDNHLYSYLRDNANIIVIPVLNVDGFLQTQRFPDSNWMGTDSSTPESSPRDGRMRRKNMLDVDENLLTQEDHRNGVDLNRNNTPYWGTNPNRSSGEVDSLVYHGPAPLSEPEIQAVDAAAGLGPIDKLSMYTDVHSFSQVHFWVRNNNLRLAMHTASLLDLFSKHHAAFPAGKVYQFNNLNALTPNQGIGSTDEYFTHTYQVPAWTLEIEPGNNAGVDYGGLGRNGHDGFILPASQIRRVRTELAQSFAVAYYRQAGPPSLSEFRLLDKATGATVFEAEWDTVNAKQRQLHQYQAQAIQLDREYTAWMAFDKPMRWRSNGQVLALPGQPPASLDADADVLVNGASLVTTVTATQWLSQPGGAPAGYERYIYDALAIDLSHPSSAANQSAINGNALATLALGIGDMTRLQIDADPSTVAHWQDGGWSAYEDSNGMDNTDSGGTDSTIQYQVTNSELGDPFVIEAGISSAWFDPSRDGEGFILEILADQRALMVWFTYDDLGQQDWYLAVGEIRGNRIVFDELLQVSGGVFGPDFDPSKITETVVGSANFIWSGCDTGAMEWQLDRDGTYRHGRMELSRLTRLMGIDCGQPLLGPELPEARFSGSWFDPSHSGEGFALELLIDKRALVSWFSFDSKGQRRWFLGVGEFSQGKFVFDQMLTTSGGVFGAMFDPAQVVEAPWGTLELDLECDGGTASFTSTEAGFPAGVLNVIQLTKLQGLDCKL